MQDVVPAQYSQTPPTATYGVASRKPEVEISRGWWRLRVLGWSNVLYDCIVFLHC